MNNYERNVKRGIRDVVDVIMPGMGLSAKALRLIGDSLSALNQKLIQECLKNQSPKRKNQDSSMPVNIALKAVEKVFKGQMRKFAESAAHKSIAKYNSGLLVYKPPSRAKLSSKTKFRVFPEFAKCVPAIAQLIQPQASMENDAKMLLAMILQRMCAKIVEKSQEASKGKGSLGTRDIMKAVDNFMAPTMARHAISEGARNSILFTRDSGQLKLEDVEARLKNVSKVMREAKDQLFSQSVKYLN